MNAYQTAQNGTIVVNLDARGRLQLVDRDRLELINRMSTNNLTLLKDGQAMETVLTTPIGRIIDVLTVLHHGEQTIVITGEGQGDSIFKYLKRNIFFMDKAKLSDMSEATRLLGVYGATATTTIENRLSADLSEFQFTEQDGVIVLRVRPLAGGGYWLIGEPDKIAAWHQQLTDAGAVEADHKTYELLCIEAGIPLTNHELTEDYIPLEAGLWHAVSFNKGCYTGQEIIARMESRGKLAKMLVRVSLDTAVPVGTELLADGGKVGTLTSIARQPEGGYLGLGFIKPAASEQTTLTTENGVAIKILGIAGTQR